MISSYALHSFGRDLEARRDLRRDVDRFHWLVGPLAHTRDRQLAYGGLVVGVQARGNERVGFGVKGMLGGGRATVVRSVTLFDDRDDLVHIQSSAIVPRIPVPIVTTARVRDAFFLAEPEANVIVNLTKRFRLTAGVGYRFAGNRERGARDNLSGVTGGVALQVGTGGS